MPMGANSVKLFAINPISGGRTKVEWEKFVREYFKNVDAEIEFYILTGKNDADSLRHWIERIKPSTVVAVGGDGTVSMVAKEVLGKDIGLGILPAGSANGMARELGIPENLNAALEIVVNNKTRQADVVNVNGHICLHLSDIGLNAKLIKHFEEGKLRGKLGYATKVIKTLWEKSPMTLKVNVHGKEEVSMKALMVVLANATMYGTGAVINPEGNLYDGQFEVVIMKRLALSELFKMWLRPQPFNPNKIKLYPATSVSIQTTRKVHFQVDGEYLGKVHTIDAHIVPGQLKLVIP